MSRTDTGMLRTVAIIATSLLALLATSSCSNNDYRREVRVDGPKGRFFVAKTGTAIALSDDTDAIDYEVGSKKLRIFKGNGGKSLGISFDKTKDLVLISYCGGRVDSVESSFSNMIAMEGDWKIYRTQVINNPGFKYGSASLCA